MAKNAQDGIPAVGLLGDPRGKLLTKLCGKSLTASQLADAVGTSANAVRVHLDGLRAAGLVDFRVERGAVGKPKHVYSLTSAAEYLLSAAYAPALDVILRQLRARLNGGLRGFLHEAGAGLAPSGRAGEAGTSRGLRLLRDLGAPARIERTDDGQLIRGDCCPLGATTRRHPEVCALLEGAMSSAIGSPVIERCDRSEHPRCAFLVEASTQNGRAHG